MIVISLISTVISFLTSGLLGGELGEKKKRGLWPYFVLGLFLGPLVLLLFLVPIPKEKSSAIPVPGKPLRVAHGIMCPACNREIPVRACSCAHCGASSSVP
jgi:hypothetical protein